MGAMAKYDDSMAVKEWFDTLPGEALEKIKKMPIGSALEAVECAVEGLQEIADSLREDLEREA